MGKINFDLVKEAAKKDTFIILNVEVEEQTFDIQLYTKLTDERKLGIAETLMELAPKASKAGLKDTEIEALGFTVFCFAILKSCTDIEIPKDLTLDQIVDFIFDLTTIGVMEKIFSKYEEIAPSFIQEISDFIENYLDYTEKYLANRKEE